MTEKQAPASALLAAIDGLEIPGGCDYCDAYQKMQASVFGPNIHIMHVYHDEWCPKHGANPRGEKETRK